MFPKLACLFLPALLDCASAPPTSPPALTGASASAMPPRPRARSFSVTVTGHGQPLILIPGLACSGRVWDDFVRHYAARYEMHVLTLAGFGGESPVPGTTLAQVRADLASYVREAGLHKPIVVGHSLGGALAFALAEREPELVGAVVAVDGVPYFAAMTNPAASPELMAAPARQLADSIAQAPPDVFRSQNRATVAAMVTDPVQVERVAGWGAASDPRTVGNAIAELMTTDLRGDEGGIRAPVLLLAAAKDVRTPEARATLSAAYEAQVARIPDHRVVLAENARHFIMLDDPTFLYAAFDAFAPRAAGGR